ncbi:MAG: peptidylprolyl isomerase [Desulfobacteraceae bacterium 4572_87]|nr:MAG: peptidylprolyl isomerase [Desulfobacteraceae bacterium 4572_87]
MKFGVILTLVIALCSPLTAFGGLSDNPQVIMETSKGTIVLEIFPDEAPETVKNFLKYVRWGHYDGTIFHRVIPNFMIQGGGFTPDMKRQTTEMPVQNEADNGLKNKRGTVAMARTPDPHSATDQFFINTKSNSFLNHKNKTAQGWGYTVFGKVVKGMDVVDAISGVKTTKKDMMGDVPVEPVKIIKMTVKKNDKG